MGERSYNDANAGAKVEAAEKFYHPFDSPTLLPSIGQQNSRAASRVSPTSDDSSRSDSPPPRMPGQSWSERVKVHRPAQKQTVKLPKMERTVKV